VSRSRTRRHSRRQQPSPLADKPFRRLSNPFAPLEVLSPEQIDQIHHASMRILEETGIEFLDGEAIQLWLDAGAQVDRQSRRVRPDRGLVMAAMARAPAEFELRARKPKYSIRLGGNHINFASVGAAPYYADFERGRRRARLEHGLAPGTGPEGTGQQT
jgi:trimethylamine--corrinoid protein Co-methyltransferase